MHVLNRAVRDAVDKNFRVWRPLERGRFDVIRGNSFNTTSVGDSLEETVHRNPRLLGVFDVLLDGPHTENDWLEPEFYPRPSEPKDGEGAVAPPLHAPVRPLTTASQLAPTAPTPLTPQNATLGNTVAVAAVATDRNTASTAPTTRTPEPVSTCRDHPTAPLAPTHQNATVCGAPPEDQSHNGAESEPPSVGFDEIEVRPVYGDEYADRLTELGKSAGNTMPHTATSQRTRDGPANCQFSAVRK
jgi:hypothetical protein